MSQAEDFSGDLPETSRNSHAMRADSLTERVVRPSFGKINRGHGGRRYCVRLREEPVPGLDEARTNKCRDGFMPRENGFKSFAVQNVVQYVVQRRGLVPIRRVRMRLRSREIAIWSERFVPDVVYLANNLPGGVADRSERLTWRKRKALLCPA